jgi:hypothetical protein
MQRMQVLLAGLQHASAHGIGPPEAVPVIGDEKL